jgi:hypothetical protein
MQKITVICTKDFENYTQGSIYSCSMKGGSRIMVRIETNPIITLKKFSEHFRLCTLSEKRKAKLKEIYKI